MRSIYISFQGAETLHQSAVQTTLSRLFAVGGGGARLNSGHFQRQKGLETATRKNELFWGSEMELLGGRQGVRVVFGSWRERNGGHRKVPEETHALRISLNRK